MFTMLPSSSRVKLNRVALKDVVGIRMVPRRKREGRTLGDVTTEPTEQEVTHQQVTATAFDSMEAKKCRVDTQRTKRRRNSHSTKDCTANRERPNTDEYNFNTSPRDAAIELSLRQAVTPTSCNVFGDNYLTPQKKTPLKKGQPNSEFKTSEGQSEKSAKEIALYPRVTLCDISQKCDVCTHNCGYKLTYFLKTKRIHCFKRDMRTGSRLRPSCVWPSKQDRTETIPFTNRLCPKSKAKKSTSQWKRLTYNQRQMTKNISSRCSTIDFLNNQTSEGSATCFNSFLLSSNISEPRTNMLVRDVEKDIGPQSDCIEAFSDFQGVDCKDILKSNSLEKVYSELSCDFKACQESSGSSRTDNWAEKNSVAPDYPYGQMCNSEESDPTEVHHQKNEVEANDRESFTCQRVRVYCGKVNKNVSCARTCMPWPFSNTRCTFAAHADTTVCQKGGNHLSTGDNCDLSLNQEQICSSNHQNNHIDNLSNEPRDFSSNTICQSFKKEVNETKAGDDSLVPTNRERCGIDTSVFWDKNNTPSCTEFEIVSVPGLTQSTPIKGPQLDSSMSTSSPSELGLSDWETTKLKSPVSSNLLQNSLSAIASPVSPSLDLTKTKLADSTSTSSGRLVTEKHLFCSDEMQLTCSSHTSSPVLLHSSDSFHSCESLSFLPQEGNREGTSQLEPDNVTHHSSLSLNRTEELFTDSNMAELLLSPILSPVRSPQRCVSRSKEKSSINQQTLPGHDVTHMSEDNQNKRTCLDILQRASKGNEEMDGILSNSTSVPSHNHSVHVIDGIQEELENSEDEQQDVLSENVPSHVLSKTPSSSRSKERSSAPEMEKTDKEDAAATDATILDEFSAYERDILLVDVIQDDPELFERLPEKGLLKLGPTRVWKAANRSSVKRCNASADVDQKLSGVVANVESDHRDVTEEDNDRPWRPWRPQGSRNPPAVQIQPGPSSDKQTRHKVYPADKREQNPEGKDHFDVNNNHPRSKASQCFQTLGPQQKISPLMSQRNSEEPRISNQTNISNFRPQKSNTVRNQNKPEQTRTNYCRQYFSDSMSCGFKVCRFQHVPMEGDEKFCMEKVTQFINKPICLLKAGAVFAGYYLNNPPGLYFSMPVFLTLLWSLLRANMVSSVLLVLRAGLTHKIAPGPEFLLALYNFVREKGLMGCVPELIQLTFKMAREGQVLNLDWIECVQNTPEFQHAVHHDFSASLSANQGAPFPDYLSLAHSVVEVELCTKQEDWRRMGKVFRSICQSIHHPNNVEQICGHIAIALLSDIKDKLSVPFATFAEAVFQSKGDNEDALVHSFFGRIGVSLMLRYHKTHQWAKGRRVVEVLSLSKISYSTLKSLFGNEDGTSRCSLITKAAELFLLSGSVEGALSTLRENNWFQSAPLWPCEPADLTSRSHVLMQLAEKTSHRDALEVLSNLPGIKEPNDLIDIFSYSPVFEHHLQVCVDRHILTVASDTVDLMLSNNLKVNQVVLRKLLHNLGKQNHWLRAREVFKHALSVGYYPGVSAPSGFMTLIVPSHLWEVELVLTFEMFISVNATVILQLLDNTTSSLTITLKRIQSLESEYLCAGSRLLCAACILQPKLSLYLKTVNSSQEQVFTLNISSARRWLHHNHSWANEVWLK